MDSTAPAVLVLSNSDPIEELFHERTLVGRILSEKVINFTAIKAILASSWQLGANVHIDLLDKNTISCKFVYDSDCERILESSPWVVKGCVLNLLRWPPTLSLEEIDFHHCKFWVQIHNLPLNKMNRANAELIGQVMGKFVYVDEDALKTRIHKYLRISVAVDTTLSLKAGCLIRREDGEHSWVHFKYERLPEFCYLCGKIEHVEKACSRPRPETDDR